MPKKRIDSDLIFPTQKPRLGFLPFILATILTTTIAIGLTYLFYTLRHIPTPLNPFYTPITIYTPVPTLFEPLWKIQHNGKQRFKLTELAQAEILLEFSNEPTDLYISFIPTVSFKAPKTQVNLEEEFYIEERYKELIPVFKTLFGINVKSTEDIQKSYNEGKTVLIPLKDLTPQVRVVEINSTYPLDTLNDGPPTFFTLYLRLKPKTSSGLLEKKVKIVERAVLQHTEFKLTKNSRSNISKVTITGVTAITRGLLLRINTLKDWKWLTDPIKPYFMDSEVIHTSNEVSFVPGCVRSQRLRFCTPPELLDILKELNINVIELTGNHLNDYGRKYLLYTLNLYQQNGINYFGGGKDIEEAYKPLILTLNNGTRIAFIGYNVHDVMIKNKAALAARSAAGAAPYDPQHLQETIKKLAEQVDFIFVHYQYTECYAYPPRLDTVAIHCYQPLKRQKELFQRTLALGANFVVGTQAHQPQKIELQEEGVILYGLGNFLFDQIQWLGTRQILVIQLYFKPTELLQIRIIPLIQEKDYKIRRMTPQEEQEFLRYIL